MSYIYSLADTWNAGGTTFTAIGMNVTDTASAAGSLLIDLQVGGVSQFKVSKAGAATITTIELGNASDTTLSRSSAGVLAVEGVAVPTISSTNTLTNKTLSSPTLSGTISGAAAFASTVTVPNNVSFRVTGSAADVRNAVKMTTADTIEFATTNNNVTLSGFTIALITTAGTVFSADNDGLIAVRNASDISLGTTTGTKIGTATTQKLGFFNQTPVVQPTAVADATDAASVITQLNALLTRMRNLGLIAT